MLNLISVFVIIIIVFICWPRSCDVLRRWLSTVFASGNGHVLLAGCWPFCHSVSWSESKKCSPLALAVLIVFLDLFMVLFWQFFGSLTPSLRFLRNFAFSFELLIPFILLCHFLIRVSSFLSDSFLYLLVFLMSILSRFKDLASFLLSAWKVSICCYLFLLFFCLFFFILPSYSSIPLLGKVLS